MYSFKSRVRYSEVDKDGYLSIEAMMKSVYIRKI